MTDHDRLFKELLSTFFLEFLELFFPVVAQAIDAESLAFLDKEIFTDITSGDRHEADLIVRARLQGEDTWFVIHVEHQAQPESNFGRRMHRYFARLHDHHVAPVYPIVLFSYANPQRLEPDEYQVTIADLEVLRFRFRVVQLNQLDWRAYLKQSNPVATALMSRMRIAIEDRPRVKAECLRLLLSLRLNRARTALITGFVDTYLRLNGEEEARFKAEFPQEDERQAVMELLTSWEERGVERGMREMLQGVLVDRFGARAQEFSGRLEGMPMSHLRDLRPIAVTGTWDEIVKALEAAC